MGRARAFTLIEVMMVVAIMGIMAAIAVPRITTLIRVRNAGIAVTQFAAAVRQGHDDARAKLRCVRLTRTTEQELQRDDSLPNADGDCVGSIVETRTIPFDPGALSLATPFDLTFGRDGSVRGETLPLGDTSFVDLPVTKKTEAGDEIRFVRVFKLLGLVRER